MKRRPNAKLTMPRALHVVRRPRVLDAIERALRAGACWVAAPAGYGKSTALADYLHSRGAAHVWYRVDDGDRDIASFFHDLAGALPPAQARRLPVFGPEYADQPQAFARRFFRAWFAGLRPGTLIVLDDLHYADAAPFHDVLAALLRELPDALRCACLARTLPPAALADFTLRGPLQVIDRTLLEFSAREAQALLRARQSRRANVDIASMRGWAIGLVLLAGEGGAPRAASMRHGRGDENAIFETIGRQLFDTLPPAEQAMLLKLGLLPEITLELAEAVAGSDAARALIERLHERQLLVAQGDTARAPYRLHDLLREFLRHRLEAQMAPAELAQLRERTALLLDAAGHRGDATDLALQAGAWPLARRLIAAQADALLAQGRRATLIDWCAGLPDGEFDAWLCYWLGVAHMADDATAEAWLSRAWAAFGSDRRGRYLVVARAVLAKTDGWRTHEGLALWTRRALELLAGRRPVLESNEELLVLTGFSRALDFAEDYRSDAPEPKRLVRRLLARLAQPRDGDSTMLRLLASQSLIEHAGSTNDARTFEQAVDSVLTDLRDPAASPWALGLWLVAFGTVSGRYFPYRRQGFAYASAEDALRTAIAIGERESLRGVEFGALYHLQLQLKQRNDLTGFAVLVARLAEIADSRHSTQVAVVADCEAALHTLRGQLPEARRACERFMSAIEAADEPPIERWPHFITVFQVLLAEGRTDEAVRFVEGRLDLFDGGARQRLHVCAAIARAVSAKQRADDTYEERFADAMRALRAAEWPAILANLPGLLAELCAEALEHGIEPHYCRALIARRRLAPPPSRPPHWPWPLRVCVLGGFRLLRDGEPLDLGNKPPTRSLDILRFLALAGDHTCSLESLYEWLWPDADGDQAKAACEQALHRLRRLLGDGDLLVQREGKLRLAAERVWVDLDDWETRLRSALAHADERVDPLEQIFLGFPGVPLRNERSTAWSQPALERVRDAYVDVADRLGRRDVAKGRPAQARAHYLRALEHYPDSARLYEGLIRGCIAQADHAGALDDYGRYERMRQAMAQPAAPLIHRLVAPLLHEAGAAPDVSAARRA
jgi:DNA-binding SARP family transcriptional activator